MKNLHFVYMISLVLLVGCATSQGVGSEFWYNNRITELDNSLKAKEITQAEYLSLKNEVDRNRIEYLKMTERSLRPRAGFGFNSFHYR